MRKSEFTTKLISIIKWIIPEVAIIFGGLLLDLISKLIVQSNMKQGDSVTLIPKFLHITYTVNRNAAFSFDFGLGGLIGEQGVRIFFIIITLLAVGFFGFLLFKKPKKGMLFRVAFSLIISGALGNLYDRIFLGYVRDFIQFEYFGLEIFGSRTFAIFNIADSCVVIGVVLLLIFFLFFDKTFKKDGEKATENVQSAAVDANKSGEAAIANNNNTVNMPTDEKEKISCDACPQAESADESDTNHDGVESLNDTSETDAQVESADESDADHGNDNINETTETDTQVENGAENK